MIKYKGRYIVAGSGVCGWGGSETFCAVADSPLGPYSEKKQMSEKRTWGSQISNFIYIRESDTVMAPFPRGRMPSWSVGTDRKKRRLWRM